LKAKQRQKEEAMHIEDTQRLVPVTAVATTTIAAGEEG
jgi:hypothetical protein